ncbi:MAG: alpha/beta hydrolase-fold protein [Planctomycetota bacterium]
MPSPPQRPYWSTISLDGHACELYDPPDAPSGRAIIYLHGVRERTLQESIGLCSCIEAAKIPALCPRAGRSWWIDAVVPAFDTSITPERFVVHHVRMEIERRFGVKPPGIALVGTRMGGQGALRLAYRHPALFPVAAAIAPAVDFHLAMQDGDDLFHSLWDIYGDVERARQDTVILHVHPLNWPRHQWFASDPTDSQWHDGSVRLHSKLNALGIPHIAILESRGDGHGMEFYNRMAPEAIRFVIESFDKESRRIA